MPSAVGELIPLNRHEHEGLIRATMKHPSAPGVDSDEQVMAWVMSGPVLQVVRDHIYPRLEQLFQAMDKYIAERVDKALESPERISLEEVVDDLGWDRTDPAVRKLLGN